MIVAARLLLRILSSGVSNKIQSLEESLQFAFTEHGGDDVAATHKLLVYIELGDGGPVTDKGKCTKKEK